MSEEISFPYCKDRGYQVGWAVGVGQSITSTGGQGVFDSWVNGVVFYNPRYYVQTGFSYYKIGVDLDREAAREECVASDSESDFQFTYEGVTGIIGRPDTICLDIVLAHDKLDLYNTWLRKIWFCVLGWLHW
jgi:hypothetical protein